MKKRLLVGFLFVLFMLLLPNKAVFAEGVESTFDENTGVLTLSGTGEIGESYWRGKKELKELIIGSGITKIGSHSFDSCRNLERVRFSNGLISIENGVFKECDSLTIITLPDSVESIGEFVLWGCDNLESVMMPSKLGFLGSYFASSSTRCYASIGSNTAKVMGNAGTKFVDPNYHKIYMKYTGDDLEIVDADEDIINVPIAESVTGIGDGAFAGCTELTSIVIPENVLKIGRVAFYNCANLKYVTLPDTLRSIDDKAFTQCPNLKSINIPENLTDFTYTAFDYNIVLYASLGSIGAKTIGTEGCSFKDPAYPQFKFWHNYIGEELEHHYTDEEELWLLYADKDIEDAVIPDGVIVIGMSGNDNAFMDCTNLKNVTIPDSVVKIYGRAFQNTGLTEVTLSANVTEIGADAFDKDIIIHAPKGSYAEQWAKENGYKTDNDSVKTVDPVNPTPPSSGDNGSEINGSNNKPGGTKTTYSDSQGIYSVDGKEAVLTKPANKNAKTLTVPATVNGANVTGIASGAFKKMKNLEKVTIGSNVTSIGKSAFQSCAKLKSVTIGTNVKSIGASAFLGCSKLKTVVFKTKKLTSKSVGSKAFSKTAAKAKVKIPKKVYKKYTKFLNKKGFGKNVKYVKK